jgi:hypothetical protein
MRMEATRGTRITCSRGMVWLTQEQDRRDHVLSAGETFVCDRAGVVLVNALAHDAVLDIPDLACCTIVAPVPGDRRAISLGADLGRIEARVEPQALLTLPAGARREIVEREAQRIRSQVNWLVFQHARRSVANVTLRLFIRVRGLLAQARRAVAGRLPQSGSN